MECTGKNCHAVSECLDGGKECGAAGEGCFKGRSGGVELIGFWKKRGKEVGFPLGGEVGGGCDELGNLGGHVVCCQFKFSGE